MADDTVGGSDAKGSSRDTNNNKSGTRNDGCVGRIEHDRKIGLRLVGDGNTRGDEDERLGRGGCSGCLGRANVCR